MTAGAAGAGVEVRGVSYRAGDALLLDAVDARFRPGALNVVLGANGAGKSTLLRVAAGVLRPTAGEVRYAGESLGTIPAEALARRRAVLSQRVTLPFPLPVREVVLMGRYPHYGRSPAAHDRAIVEAALAEVGMGERADQAYPTLSGGEQQKVQLARVLAQIWADDAGGAGAAPGAARGPATYLFLDEPTAGLDVRYQLHLLDVARALVARGCTVVAVLHDLNVALEHGGRVLVLDRGRVALETDEGSDLSAALIERVFGVRARRVADPEGGGVWRFGV